MDFGNQGDPARRLAVFLLGGGQDEANGCDQKNGGEDIADPLEVREEFEAGGDKGPAHEDGAEDSPEEDFGLAVRVRSGRRGRG